MKKQILTLSMTLLGTMALLGCDTESDDTTLEASLSGDVLPIFQQECAGCHLRDGAPFPEAVANGIYFETKEDILAMVGTFVVPGASADSGLLGVLRQDFGVGATPTLMPPPQTGAPAMSEENMNIVAQWIDEGANDN